MPSDLFTVRAAAMPPETRVLSLEGAEGISRLYRFGLHLLVPAAASADLDPEAVIGSDLTLEIHDGDGAARRHYHGVVVSLELVHELGGDALWHAEVAPRVWKLALSLHSRVFANETFHAVVEKVLQSYGLQKDQDYALRLPVRRPYDHLCQYQESDLDFLSRVMEREGYYYFFEHGESHEVLVIAAAKDVQAPLDPAAPQVPFFPLTEGETSGVEALHTFSGRHTAVPNQVLLQDYDYMRPSTIRAEAAVPHGLGAMQRHWGDNHMVERELTRVATARRDELQTAHVAFKASGRVFNLAAGFFFDLEDHPRATWNRRYLCTELHHRGSNASGAATERERGGSDRTYEVELRAIPGDQQFRPARVTPVPRIYGVETGVVCGAADSPYAQLDSHGRYKIKVHFDEGTLRGGRASMFVRMIQPHGGNPEGFHFPLRKETEVMVVFLGGDPDRPVIVGAAPNAARPSVVTEANHTHNVIHTGSNNRVEMEDSEGSQYIDITTPPMNTGVHLGALNGSFDHNVVITTDGTGLIHTGQSLDVTVDDWKHEVVGNYVDEDFHNDHLTTVDGKRHEIVQGEVIEEYHSTLSTTVDCPVNIEYLSTLEHHTVGDAQETFDATLTTTVTGALTENYDGGQTVHVKSGQTVDVLGGASHTYDTMDQKVTGDIFATIGGTDLTFKMANSSDTVLGIKNENHIGLKIETLVGGKIEGFLGVKIETALAAKIELAASLELLSKTAQFELVGMKIKKKSAEMGNVSITIVQQSLTITQVAMFVVA